MRLGQQNAGLQGNAFRRLNLVSKCRNNVDKNATFTDIVTLWLFGAHNSILQVAGRFRVYVLICPIWGHPCHVDIFQVINECSVR